MSLSVTRHQYDPDVGNYGQQITALVQRGGGLQTILVFDKPLEDDLSSLTSKIQKFIDAPKHRFSDFAFVKKDNSLSFEIKVQSGRDDEVIGDSILLIRDGAIAHSRGRTNTQILKVFQIIRIEVERYQIQKENENQHIHVNIHFVVAPNVERWVTLLEPYDCNGQNYSMWIDTVSQSAWQELQSAL